MNYSGLNTEEKSVSDIVFKIGPRLNASGRIEHGKKSVAIMTATNEQEALLLGDEINSYNEIRKTLDRDITQEALEMIRRDPEHEGKNATVLYNRDWHKGVVGIVNRMAWQQVRLGLSAISICMKPLELAATCSNRTEDTCMQPV